jgi:hypothetical protein
MRRLGNLSKVFKRACNAGSRWLCLMRCCCRRMQPQITVSLSAGCQVRNVEWSRCKQHISMDCPTACKPCTSHVHAFLHLHVVLFIAVLSPCPPQACRVVQAAGTVVAVMKCLVAHTAVVNEWGLQSCRRLFSPLNPCHGRAAAVDCCTEACQRSVCVNAHNVPAWNDACLKKCTTECLRGRSQ